MVFLAFSASNYMFKVNNRKTKTRCEKCSKLTIKIPERRQWRHFGIFIVNFEHILQLVLVLLLLTHFITTFESFYKVLPCDKISPRGNFWRYNSSPLNLLYESSSFCLPLSLRSFTAIEMLKWVILSSV